MIPRTLCMPCVSSGPLSYLLGPKIVFYFPPFLLHCYYYCCCCCESGVCYMLDCDSCQGYFPLLYSCVTGYKMARNHCTRHQRAAGRTCLEHVVVATVIKLRTLCLQTDNLSHWAHNCGLTQNYNFTKSSFFFLIACKDGGLNM